MTDLTKQLTRSDSVREILQEFLALEEKITPGPWGICLGSGNNLCTAIRYENPENGKTEFVADFLTGWMLKECPNELPKDHTYNMRFTAQSRTLAPRMTRSLKKFLDSQDVLCRCEEGGFQQVKRKCYYCCLVLIIQDIMDGKE